MSPKNSPDTRREILRHLTTFLESKTRSDCSISYLCEVGESTLEDPVSGFVIRQPNETATITILINGGAKHD